ncbi:MAG: Bcr/CflA family efflux MFS transporter [Clostridia bacterium]|nr:Bcr/CflA family efflux MFS transporter [Clostridia bacterium]
MEGRQKYLKTGGLIFLVTLLGMTGPLSTDMYMPSLPNMAHQFNTSATIVNFTLVVFFLFMAVGMLFFGPLSDRHGRKKILLTALTIYALSSLMCAFATNAYFLIIMRALQGLGGGGMSSMSVAIIKDSFEAERRAKALAVVQSMTVIAPIVAPVIGAMIVRFAMWRVVFVVLTCIAAVGIVTTALFQESIHDDERNYGGVLKSLGRILVVGRNINFTPYLLSVSLYIAPFMAYLAVASYTYIEFFGLTETMFSVFFATNAGLSVLGPMLFIRLNGKVSQKLLMRIVVSVGIVVSVLLFTVGRLSPIAFLCCMIPFSMSNSFLRPLSTNILLDQQKGDTGSASALLNFSNMLFGSIGMFIGSLPWGNFIVGLAITMLCFSVASSVVWTIVSHTKKIDMHMT